MSQEELDAFSSQLGDSAGAAPKEEANVEVKKDDMKPTVEDLKAAVAEKPDEKVPENVA